MPQNISFRFLSNLEGGSKVNGYVPAAALSKSGVTIATGFDLGQHNENDLIALKLDPLLIADLKHYLGAKGANAQALLKKRPLVITLSQARMINKAVKRSHIFKLKLKYNAASRNGVRFINLPPQAQKHRRLYYLSHFSMALA